MTSINSKFIKLFSYIDKNGAVCDLNTYYGQKWSEIETDNEMIKSIFDLVDDGDGVVQAKELNALNKLLCYIDSLVRKTKGNNIAEDAELKKFMRLYKKGRINIDEILNKESDNTRTCWSEGLDRKISTIQIPREVVGELLYDQLRTIGEEQGFTLEVVYGKNRWLEDSSIMRHDGKIYVPCHSDPSKTTDLPYNEYKSPRGNDNKIKHGAIIQRGHSLDLDIDARNKYYGTSYLEGGNVLNTCKADGTPAAIVGEASIEMTLEIEGLENTPENVELVKQQIAEDLGLALEQVTFIPQHEFHIDMIYHPLQNGKVAIPDYEEGLNILRTMFKQKCDDFDYLKKHDIIRFMKERESLRDELDDIWGRIEDLEEVVFSTKSIREEANDYLTEGGYEIVKIPCFTTNSSDRTNFMNGVGGTSEKTGQKFFITNHSDLPELEGIMIPYFKKAGIDKVYFVSTEKWLRNQGGIDCLTQER